ncbi:unnamed protein product, partial [Allacma fusca]
RYFLVRTLELQLQESCGFYLFSLFLCTTPAALYLELACPGIYGVKLPWYYPFTIWFWTGKTRESKLKSINPNQFNQDNFEAEPEDWIAGVEFQNL